MPAATENGNNRHPGMRMHWNRNGFDCKLFRSLNVISLLCKSENADVIVLINQWTCINERILPVCIEAGASCVCVLRQKTGGCQVLSPIKSHESSHVRCNQCLFVWEREINYRWIWLAGEGVSEVFSTALADSHRKADGQVGRAIDRPTVAQWCWQRKKTDRWAEQQDRWRKWSQKQTSKADRGTWMNIQPGRGSDGYSDRDKREGRL